jgi:ribosomal protein L37AE/L43A
MSAGSNGTAGMHDVDGAAEVRWAPRLTWAQVRRLYKMDALGIVDDDLIQEVGLALEARCESILAVHDAQRGNVHCPRCAREDRVRLISHTRKPDDVLRCRACGWQTTFGAYQATYRHKQLNAGGAHAAFVNYLHQFRQSMNPRQKMLAIDRLIHEFHYSLKDRPDVPTRPAGVNLIDGTMTEVIALLDELAYGTDAGATSPQIRESGDAWRQKEAQRRAVQESPARRRDGAGEQSRAALHPDG